MVLDNALSYPSTHVCTCVCVRLCGGLVLHGQWYETVAYGLTQIYLT